MNSGRFRTAMPAMCENCPFRDDGNAIELRAGRLAAIKDHILIGGKFPCHKTVHVEKTAFVADEDGSERVEGWQKHFRECRGAVEFHARASVEEIGAAFDRIMSEVRDEERRRDEPRRGRGRRRVRARRQAKAVDVHL